MKIWRPLFRAYRDGSTFCCCSWFVGFLLLFVSLLYHTFVSYSFLQFYSIIINIFTCIRFPEFIISFLFLFSFVSYSWNSCMFHLWFHLCDWTGEKEKDEKDASFIFLILCLNMNATKKKLSCMNPLFVQWDSREWDSIHPLYYYKIHVHWWSYTPSNLLFPRYLT